MSVQATTWVIEHSESTLGARLTLLSIANHADRYGEEAWPSVATIAAEARLSARQVQYCVRKLEEMGELQVYRSPGRKSNCYRLPKMANPANIAGLNDRPNHAIHDTQPCNLRHPTMNPIAPKPSLTVQNHPVGKRRDLIFETLAEVAGIDWHGLTSIERGRLNKAAKALREVEATPETIRARAARYREQWPRVSLTPTALAAHWSECVPGGANAAAGPVLAQYRAPEEIMNLAQSHGLALSVPMDELCAAINRREGLL